MGVKLTVPEIPPKSSHLDWLRLETGGDEGLFYAVAKLLSSADEQGRITGIVGRSAAKLAKREAMASIGRYEILSLLGEGGMGDVYLARRADGEYTQQVAIKVLGSRRPGKEMIRRFQAERQILANLDHPNIARLINGGDLVVVRGRRVKRSRDRQVRHDKAPDKAPKHIARPTEPPAGPNARNKAISVHALPRLSHRARLHTTDGDLLVLGGVSRNVDQDSPRK